MTTTRRAFQSLLPFAPAAFARGSPPRQNVLFLALDGLNDWVGCLGGQPRVLTPNIDRMSRRSVLFASAHCAGPLGNPSRTALLFGRRPSSTGVYLNSQPYSGSRALAEAASLNQHFKDNGYLTLGCGKIYHGTPGVSADRQGWDDYGQPQGDFTLPASKSLAAPAPQGQFVWGPTQGGDEEMNDYHVTEWVNAHLRKRRGQPMFLACGLFRPRLPWYVPKKYFDRYRPDSARPPVAKSRTEVADEDERVRNNGASKDGVRAYMAAISFADAMVGRVLRALETGPNAHSTSVVLWGDHGWHLDDDLTWSRFMLRERSTRNLLMIAAPGMPYLQARVGFPVSMIDVYPTLMDITGVRPPGGLEGMSLYPFLKNPLTQRTQPAITTCGRGNHAVRTGEWRYIRYSDGGEELYDLEEDRAERHNVAAWPPMAEIKTEMARWLPTHNEPDVPKRSA